MKYNDQLKIAEPEKALLDYLYLHPHLDSSPDWEGLRLNITTLEESISHSKINDYLNKKLLSLLHPGSPIEITFRSGVRNQ